MTIDERKEELTKQLRDKEYRDAYVKASINVGVPSQILALREQRGWTQKELGDRASLMKQESISRLEDPTRGSVTIKTLLRLASAFDVGLMVRFIPFSEMVDWKLKLSLKSLEVESFDKDPYFKEESEEDNIALREAIKEAGKQPDCCKVLYMADFQNKKDSVENQIPTQPINDMQSIQRKVASVGG